MRRATLSFDMPDLPGDAESETLEVTVHFNYVVPFADVKAVTEWAENNPVTLQHAGHSKCADGSPGMRYQGYYKVVELEDCLLDE